MELKDKRPWSWTGVSVEQKFDHFASPFVMWFMKKFRSKVSVVICSQLRTNLAKNFEASHIQSLSPPICLYLSLCISLPLSIYLSLYYVYLFIFPSSLLYGYPYLSLPMYIYLYLSTSLCTYLSLPISLYLYHSLIRTHTISQLMFALSLSLIHKHFLRIPRHLPTSYLSNSQIYISHTDATQAL